MNLHPSRVSEATDVFITAWRAAPWLKWMLRSLENQTLRPRTVWVGVDGCQETLDAVNALGPSQLNLRLFWNPENCGTYVLKANLINLSDSQNIAVLDADDMVHPLYLETLEACLNDPKVRLCAANTWVRFSHLEGDAIAYKVGKYGAADNAYSRDLWEEVGPYLPVRYSGDFEWLHRCFKLKHCVYLDRNAIKYYRRHDNQITKLAPIPSYAEKMGIEVHPDRAKTIALAKSTEVPTGIEVPKLALQEING